MENTKIINGIEYTNIGSEENPYYCPKPTEEQKHMVKNLMEKYKRK